MLKLREKLLHVAEEVQGVVFLPLWICLFCRRVFCLSICFSISAAREICPVCGPYQLHGCDRLPSDHLDGDGYRDEDVSLDARVNRGPAPDSCCVSLGQENAVCQTTARPRKSFSCFFTYETSELRVSEGTHEMWIPSTLPPKTSSRLRSDQSFLRGILYRSFHSRRN